MPIPSHRVCPLVSLALGLLWVTSCSQKSHTFAPATAFSESFAPFQVVASVAQKEGLSSTIHGGGSTCTRGSGGSIESPTVTTVYCRGRVGFQSREDGVRLTRAVFAELEQEVRRHAAESVSFGKSGSPEEGELHLSYCPQEKPRGEAPGTRGCTFLHFFAFEKNEAPAGSTVDYRFLLDEERATLLAANDPSGRG